MSDTGMDQVGDRLTMDELRRAKRSLGVPARVWINGRDLTDLLNVGDISRLMFLDYLRRQGVIGGPNDGIDREMSRRER